MTTRETNALKAVTASMYGVVDAFAHITVDAEKWKKSFKRLGRELFLLRVKMLIGRIIGIIWEGVR